MAAVKRMALLEGVEIVALSDLKIERIDEAKAYLKKLGMPEPKGMQTAARSYGKRCVTRKNWI